MIGVVVLNYNVSNLVKECVNSILRNGGSKYQIVIVDNGSSDNSCEEITNYVNGLSDKYNVTFFSLENNMGYSFGNNFGESKLDDVVDYVAFINPDIILENNAIDLLYEELINNKELAVVGPLIKNPNQLNYEGPKSVSSVDDYMGRRKLFFWKKYSDEFSFDFEKKSMVFLGMVYGAFFLIDRKVFHEIEKFDEKLFLYTEENVMAAKLMRINKKVAIIRDAKVQHKHSISASKAGDAFRRIFSLTSELYSIRKYGNYKLIPYYFISFMALIQYLFYGLIFYDYRKNIGRFIERWTRSVFID